jgi:hypothetical protein
MRKTTTVTDDFGDVLEVEQVSSGLLIIAKEVKRSRATGFVFNNEEVKKLRDALNEYLGESPLRPISFGGGGNTVIVLNNEVSEFSPTQAEALKKLVSGIIAQNQADKR